MKKTQWTHAAQITALSVLLLVAGCHKNKPAPPPPPPPPPPSPTASISANPATINAGQSTQLTWQTDNATDVSIEGVGKVQASGSQTVTPTDSTTYRLTASGPGGTQDATTRVTVTRPQPVAQAAPQEPSLSDQQLFEKNVKDAYFDYDSYEVRPQDSAALQADAQFITQHPGWRILVEGHCDERGSTEYNMALGDSRAQSTKQALVAAGVAANRVTTTSFGKEKPFCTESNEQCWQQNRRGHLVLAGQ
ncbi:MAG: peptidoglycan-associated lipoprotein Pal [Terriglobales bacterium]